MRAKEVRPFHANEIICLEGEAGNCAYLIETGQVQVFVTKDGAEVLLKVLGQGEIFGEMSMIDNSLRSASCRALTDVRLAVVTQGQLLDRIHASDPIVRLLMRALLDRLREQNDLIRGKVTEHGEGDPSGLNKVRVEALGRIRLENRIAIGLENNEFGPFYQPIYDLETQQIRGCEALIRWIPPDGKLISPNEFIDVLEQSPLILDVGKMMIEKCALDLARMRQELSLPPDFFVSVNVSGKQFDDPHFLEHLEEARRKASVPAENLKLEVTERIMTEGPQAISTLQNCRSLGYKIAIDDFGTGFSSLQYLASMPLHDLKVDRSFVSQMMTQEKSLSIVKTLIHMAGLLNLNLIAEGIETRMQLQLLRNLGVQLGQGFYFAKAMPYDEFVALNIGESRQKAA